MSFEWSGALPPRWVVPLFGLAALLLVPWVFLTIADLPSAHRSAHWDIAWGGFDIALALLLLSVAIAAWRGSPWLEGAATATATLLFVDAWFDVLTSSTRAEFVVAILEAAFVELPLAFLCLLLARGAERLLRVPLSAKRAVDDDLVEGSLERGELLIVELRDKQLSNAAQVDRSGLGEPGHPGVGQRDDDGARVRIGVLSPDEPFTDQPGDTAGHAGP
jgi:hypothetical protein